MLVLKRFKHATLRVNEVKTVSEKKLFKLVKAGYWIDFNLVPVSQILKTPQLNLNLVVNLLKIFFRFGLNKSLSHDFTHR